MPGMTRSCIQLAKSPLPCLPALCVKRQQSGEAVEGGATSPFVLCSSLSALQFKFQSVIRICLEYTWSPESPRAMLSDYAGPERFRLDLPSARRVLVRMRPAENAHNIGWLQHIC